MPRPDSPVRSSRFLLLASICVVVAALYFAQDVLIPLALALLLRFLLAPLVNRLERWRIHRAASVIIVVSLALGAVAGVGYVVWHQLLDLTHDLPKYRGNIVAKVQAVRLRGRVIHEFQKNVAEIAAAPATTRSTQPSTREASAPTPVSRRHENPPPPPPPGTAENPLYVVPHEPPPTPLAVIQNAFGPLIGPLGTAGVVIVITIFMLLAREDLRDRVIRLVGGGHLTLTTQALDDAATRISRYLLMQSIVNTTYGVTIAIGLALIGVPNPLLWGLLCGVLRFVPYVGVWIAAAFPVLLSIAVFPGVSQAIETGVLFAAVELLINSFMEPWLYGASTGMSAVAVLVAAVFWAWLWGPIGLLLATPLTVILVVLGKYVPQLEFLDVLLGDQPVLTPPARVYQRRLSLDQEEAAEVVHEYLKEHSLEEVYDTVVLPALAMAEQDRHRGNLDDRRQAFINQAVRELIDELGDEHRAATVRADAAEIAERAKSPDGVSAQAAPKKRLPLRSDCVINIVCLPAHHAGDELACLMLAQLLEIEGYRVTTATNTALAGEMIRLIEENNADVVCVSALPPGAISHARYLCKRINSKHPDLNVVIGLWTAQGDLKRSKQRVTCGGAAHLVTTLKQAMDEIQQLAQLLIMRAEEKKKPAFVTPDS